MACNHVHRKPIHYRVTFFDGQTVEVDTTSRDDAAKAARYQTQSSEARRIERIEKIIGNTTSSAD